MFVLAPPIWRRDGRAVAWIERSNGEARVVVIDGVGDRVAPLPLALPAVAADDRVFWAGQQRIHIGPALLAPRAVATWNDSARRLPALYPEEIGMDSAVSGHQGVPPMMLRRRSAACLTLALALSACADGGNGGNGGKWRIHRPAGHRR